MATILGLLTVKLGADTTDLKSGAREAEDVLSRLGDGAKKAGLAIAALTAASITAAVALLVHLTRSSLETIDAQSKLAYRLGGTIDAVQVLEHAATMADVSVGALTKAAEKLNQALAEASRTTDGKANEALKRLGLNAQTLLRLNIDERISAISQRMFELGYSTAQQAEVLKSFNIRGQALINVFEGGAKAFKEARHDIETFGVALKGIDGVKVEMANDAWKRAHLIFTAVGNQLAVQLAPFIGAIGERIAEAARQAGGFGNVIAKVIEGSIRAFGEFLGVIYDVRIAVYSMMQSFEGFFEFFTRDRGIISFFTTLQKSILDTGAAMKDKLDARLKASGKEATKYVDIIAVKYADLVAKLGERPSAEGMIEFVKHLTAEFNALAKETDDARKKMLTAPPPKLDPFTAEQKKALQDRLNNLKKEIESEDLALVAQKNKQLAEIADLERKGYITRQVGAALKLEVDEKYEKSRKELVQSMLEETILKEDEINTRAYEKRLRDLDIFERNKTISTQLASNIRLKLEQKHAIDLAQIQAKSWSGLASIVDTSLGQIAQIIGKQGGAAFEVMKAISYATALVKGYEAVVSAYAAGTSVGGPALGAVFAAVAAAGVAAQIAAIAKTKPGGATGAVPSASGGGSGDGGGGSSGSAGGGAGSNQTISIRGLEPSHLYTGEAIRTIANGLVQFQRDGGKVIYE